MDEVFGSENFVSLISYTSTSGIPTSTLARSGDYILWYVKDIQSIKYRQLFELKSEDDYGHYNLVYQNGNIRRLTLEEKDDLSLIPKNAKLATSQSLTSQGETKSDTEINLNGKKYNPPSGQHWKTTVPGILNLYKKNRIILQENSIRYLRFIDDFDASPIKNLWTNTVIGSQEKIYVVQTSVEIIQRCLLMTTDPGDLVLDPTCGSGTTAFVAEQWGRRWMTLDTSRIALNIAKQRLMTATYPYYKLYSEQSVPENGQDQHLKTKDIRQGFVYKTVPHITLKSLANDEPPATETLYDQPEIDRKKLRVSGPFTVETLQNFEPVSPAELETEQIAGEDAGEWSEKIKQHLLSTGIKNGRKDERVNFIRVELLADPYLHAEGFFMNGVGEKKSYFHIGPKFGTVSKNAVNEAVKACRIRGDAQWLVILGFCFESDIEGDVKTMSMGHFEVTKARIHDDLLQEGLKKKPAKSAASFVTIGEPDIEVHKKENLVTVEICGLDIYDPIKDEVKARNVSDIAYWMVDDDYDGSNFIVKQVFFCGGDRDEFEKWKRGLSDISKHEIKRKAEKTLKIEIDDEAFDRLYGHVSLPIEIKKKDQKIAVRVISMFGEETTKVVAV